MKKVWGYTRVCELNEGQECLYQGRKMRLYFKDSQERKCHLTDSTGQSWILDNYDGVRAELLYYGSPQTMFDEVIAEMPK